MLRGMSYIPRPGPKHPFRFRLYKEDSKGSTLKEIVETKDGDVARLLERNGKPLSATRKQRSWLG